MCVCAYDIAYDIIVHTGVGGPLPIRFVFGLDGSNEEK